MKKIATVLLMLSSLSARAECISFVPVNHLASGEGELWRFTENAGGSARLRRSLVFYYHNVPFSIDNTVADMSLTATTEDDLVRYSGEIDVGNRRKPLTFRIDTPTTAEIDIGGRLIRLKKSVVRCVYMNDDAP